MGKEKFLLYFMDEEVLLYKENGEKIYSFKNSFEEARSYLENYLNPKASVSLLVDRTQEDFHEEKLPSLFPWDRIRLLFYKKESLAIGGGYGGFKFFKEKKETYLRWIHIPEIDPLSYWISFVLSRSGNVFFAPLEGKGFLKNYFSSQKPYQMLIYALPSEKIRHVIFKGDRILLSRLSYEEEEIKGSLHFLNRKHPDIYENIEWFICGENKFLKEAHVYPDPMAFIRFVMSRKRPSFLLYPNFFSKSSWIKKGLLALSILSFSGGCMGIYVGQNYKNKTTHMLEEIHFLKKSITLLRTQIQNKDISFLRTALEKYEKIKSHKGDFFNDCDQLFQLLENFSLRLQSLKWLHREKREIVLKFLLKTESIESLVLQFEGFQSAIHGYFPGSRVIVLEAPFRSGTHETFKNVTETLLPLVSLKIVFP